MPVSRLTKIGIGWTCICVSGIGLFYLSKKSVDKRRYEDMKIRQRMKESNSGDYQPSYRFSSVKKLQ